MPFQFVKRLWNEEDKLSYSNPHAEPAQSDQLKRSLSFLLAHLAKNGKLMDEAYTMLLGSELDQKRGLGLIARQIAAKRLGNQEDAGGGTLELDLHSGLHIALLDCEKEAAPVSAVSLQSVEDELYEGYQERRSRRSRLVRFTVISFILAILLDAVSSGLMVVEKTQLRRIGTFEIVSEMAKPKLPVLAAEQAALMTELEEAGVDCRATATDARCRRLRRIQAEVSKLIVSVLYAAGEQRGALLESVGERGVDCRDTGSDRDCLALADLQSNAEALVAPHLYDLQLAELGELDAQEYLLRAMTYFLRSFTLFFWGVVGGGFYMLRRLYEFVESRTYDPAMKGMHFVTLLIGGLAGTLLPVTIFPQLLGFADPMAVADPSLMLTATGIAVVAGFGSKFIYGLFEKILEGLQVVVGLRTSNQS